MSIEIKHRRNCILRQICPFIHHAIQKKMPTFDCQSLHEDLLLALLKHNLLLPLVGSSVYPVILQFVMKLSVHGSDLYNLAWLIEKLPKEKYVAEVGQLKLNILGVPAALKGFRNLL